MLLLPWDLRRIRFISAIYLKVIGRKFVFFVLYVDDILLTSIDLGMLRETK